MTAGGTASDALVGAEPTREALLDVRNVSLRFAGVQALDDVSMSIIAGGTTAIIGPNGAGKTTLFNCITGLVRPSGEIVLGGIDISDASPHRRARSGLARTFQTPRLVDDKTLFENVMFGAMAHCPRPMARSSIGRSSSARARCDYVIERLGLSRERSTRASKLPHAIRRRVEVARAFASAPRLVLMDEPAAGLSVAEALELGVLCDELAAEDGCTVLLVEHSVDLVMRVAHTVVVLATGAVLCSGPPAAVRSHPDVIACYLGIEAASA